MVKKTTYQKRKQKREERIFRDFNRMIDNENSMATAIVEDLKEKYNIESASTIYRIIKRVKKRLEPVSV